MNKPSVGRIVHYVSYGTPGGEYIRQCRAAIITEVTDNPEQEGAEVTIGLAVLNPSGMFFNAAQHDGSDNPKGGTWHWSERVD